MRNKSYRTIDKGIKIHVMMRAVIKTIHQSWFWWYRNFVKQRLNCETRYLLYKIIKKVFFHHLKRFLLKFLCRMDSAGRAPMNGTTANQTPAFTQPHYSPFHLYSVMSQNINIKKSSQRMRVFYFWHDTFYFYIIAIHNNKSFISRSLMYLFKKKNCNTSNS